MTEYWLRVILGVLVLLVIVGIVLQLVRVVAHLAALVIVGVLIAAGLFALTKFLDSRA
ncbi:hypothetical protein [Denitrobacterium detoxificans]|jgi:hypothetical protein|uniref:Uncharacterized protein n=1 Tax=Denitrobacterium detoxificans TaxID=79604 RepID=A0A1H8QN44_9ACTN|nr:hypothetical protein [Denitrobacterium detoxificans]SEO55649.1 hypothetical protein SAMN02910314_00550 [Denitrobacterium detoxificans]